MRVFSYLIITFFAFLIISCSGPSYLAKNKDLTVQPDIEVVQQGDSVYILFSLDKYTLKRNNTYSFIRSIKDVNIKMPTSILKMNKIVNNENIINDKLLQLVSLYHVGISKDSLNDKSVLQFEMNTAEGIYLFESKLSKLIKKTNEQKEDIKMIHYFKRSTDGLEIEAYAFRRRTNKEEYQPDSEDFRVKITKKLGPVVWTSDFDKDFMTATNKVKPEGNGQVAKYNIGWPGVSNKGKAVPPAMYKIKITIPAFPKPYSKIVKYRWEP